MCTSFSSLFQTVIGYYNFFFILHQFLALHSLHTAYSSIVRNFVSMLSVSGVVFVSCLPMAFYDFRLIITVKSTKLLSRPSQNIFSWRYRTKNSKWRRNVINLLLIYNTTTKLSIKQSQMFWHWNASCEVIARWCSNITYRIRKIYNSIINDNVINVHILMVMSLLH